MMAEETGSILVLLGVRPVGSAALDAVLRQPERPPLTVLFLWGRNCPNCDIAKREMARTPERFRWPEVGWLHCNVYEDPDMAVRFGPHGIPVFRLFRRARPIGRITAWPGTEAFATAIDRQVAGPR